MSQPMLFYKTCKCPLGPQAKMFIKNLREFEVGYGTLPTLPAIDTEGTCRVCGVVVRASEELHDRAAGTVIDILMMEVTRLRAVIDRAQAESVGKARAGRRV